VGEDREREGRGRGEGEEREGVFRGDRGQGEDGGERHG
jgi:hypothetical protein